MAINFEAANMAGYNNPSIEIINAAFDPEGNITNITYNDIVKTLSRGVFPIVAFPAGGPDYNLFMPLAVIENDEIRFCSVDIYGSADAPTSDIFGLVFTPSGPPKFMQKSR